MDAHRDEYSAIGATLPHVGDLHGSIEDKSGDVTRHGASLNVSLSRVVNATR
jgi:hypothetical protein